MGLLDTFFVGHFFVLFVEGQFISDGLGRRARGYGSRARSRSVKGVYRVSGLYGKGPYRGAASRAYDRSRRFPTMFRYRKAGDCTSRGAYGGCYKTNEVRRVGANHPTSAYYRSGRAYLVSRGYGRYRRGSYHRYYSRRY